MRNESPVYVVVAFWSYLEPLFCDNEEQYCGLSGSVEKAISTLSLACVAIVCAPAPVAAARSCGVSV